MNKKICLYIFYVIILSSCVLADIHLNSDTAENIATNWYTGYDNDKQNNSFIIQPHETGNIYEMNFTIIKFGSPTDNMYINIYALDESDGKSPSGISLGDSYIDMSSFTAGWTSETFTFGTPISVTAETNYTIVFSRDTTYNINWAGIESADSGSTKLCIKNNLGSISCDTSASITADVGITTGGGGGGSSWNNEDYRYKYNLTLSSPKNHIVQVELFNTTCVDQPKTTLLTLNDVEVPYEFVQSGQGFNYNKIEFINQLEAGVLGYNLYCINNKNSTDQNGTVFLMKDNFDDVASLDLSKWVNHNSAGSIDNKFLRIKGDGTWNSWVNTTNSYDLSDGIHFGFYYNLSTDLGNKNVVFGLVNNISGDGVTGWNVTAVRDNAGSKKLCLDNGALGTNIYELSNIKYAYNTFYLNNSENVGGYTQQDTYYEIENYSLSPVSLLFMMFEDSTNYTYFDDVYVSETYFNMSDGVNYNAGSILYDSENVAGSMTVRVWDELLSIPIDWDSITVNLISVSDSRNITISTGNVTFGNLTPNDYTIRAYSYNYSTTLLYTTLNVSEYKIVDVYMLNNTESTDSVTVKVIDESVDYVSDATVRLYKYYVDSNSYIEVNSVLTNDNGDAVFPNVLFGEEYYKWIVEYNGVQVLETTPAYIYSSTKTLQINLGIDYAEDFTVYENITIDLTFDVDNNWFRLSYKNVPEEAEYVCIRATRIDNMNEYDLGSSCGTPPTSIIYKSITRQNGSTFVGDAYYTESNGNEKHLDTVTYTYPEGYVMGDAGWFIYIIIMMATVLLLGSAVGSDSSVAYIIVAPLILIAFTILFKLGLNTGYIVGFAVVCMGIAGYIYQRRLG